MAGTAYRTASHPYPALMSQPSSPSAARIWSGLGVVYFFWGTTYLALDPSNHGIPPLAGTGIVALIIALVPVWIALIDRVLLRSAPLGMRVVVGLIGGFGGAAVLVGGQVAGHVTVLGLLVTVVASLSWACGSLYQRSAPIAAIRCSRAACSSSGGIAIGLVALFAGQFRELHPSQVSRESALALL